MYQNIHSYYNLHPLPLLKIKLFMVELCASDPRHNWLIPKHIQIENCTFKENEAYNGGAVYTKGEDIYITNLSVVGNSALNNGGGIALMDASL